MAGRKRIDRRRGSFDHRGASIAEEEGDKEEGDGAVEKKMREMAERRESGGYDTLYLGFSIRVSG
ncbi:hypothetical protein ACLOJK_011363 [Asimina triloba]